MIDVTVTQYASSDKINIDELVSYTLRQEYVIGARAFEIDGTTVIAALTVPFVLKSERDKAKADIYEELKNLSDGDIVLTFDMQVYRNIEDDLDEQSKKELLRLAKSR